MHHFWRVIQQNWNKDAKNVPLEILANMASIDICNYDSKLELKTMFKELFDAYTEIVK